MSERKRRRIRIPYILLAVLLGLFAYQFVMKMQEIRSLRQQQAVLRYENQQTAQENALLERQSAYYRTVDYVRNAARTFGYTGPGEEALQSHPVYQRGPSLRSMPVYSQTASLPVWKQWWQAFFG